MDDRAIYRHIHARAKELAGYTVENLSRLVRIPSLSGGERAAAEELSRQMEEAGFEDVATDGFGNVIGTIGRGHTMLALDAHVDTVDMGSREEWEFDPYCGELRDGALLGLGSADQKGGAAAMVTAGRIARELDFDHDLNLLALGTVMQEECSGLAWKYIIEEDAIRPDLVICTEPTGCSVHRGQLGRMELEVVSRGSSCDGGSPEHGRNAVYPASRLCLAIEELNDRLRPDEFLGKGSIRVSGVVTRSPSLAAVPDYTGLHIDRRLTWGETKGSVLAELMGLLSTDGTGLRISHCRAKSYTGYEYGIDRYYPPWLLPADDPAIRRATTVFERLFGESARIGTSNIPTNSLTINGIYGIPVIGFGPGSESAAHVPNEKTSTEELIVASAFYAAYAYAVSEKSA